MTGYLIDGETQRIAIAARDTDDEVTFEPWTDGHAIGFKIIRHSDGAAEYLILNPSNGHDVNPDNGAISDTFIYHVTDPVPEGEDLISAASYAAYINHFEGTIKEDDDA